MIAEQLLANDGNRFVVFSGQADTSKQISPRPLRLTGLDGAAQYRVELINRDQAVARAETDGQNKGGGAAAAALHLIALARKWGGQRKGAGFKPASDEYQIAGFAKGKDLA